jgi:hypothetical protein
MLCFIFWHIFYIFSHNLTCCSYAVLWNTHIIFQGNKIILKFAYQISVFWNVTCCIVTDIYQALISLPKQPKS